MGDYDGNQYNGWQENSGNEDMNTSYACTSWAPGVGFAGITCAVVFASKFQFQLVLRLNKHAKQSLRGVLQLYLSAMVTIIAVDNFDL